MQKILHVDMDAFYASVAQHDDPRLRGRPVVVGGSPDGRGVVAAASYEARAYGIHSAMPAGRARRLCPDLIFVPGDFRRYKEVSSAMHGIFADFTDRVEPLSLDEAYLDVTENKVGLAWASQVAKAIRTRIRDELGVTASAGLAPSRSVAKIASDHRKPDGLTVVPPEDVVKFLHPLPIGKVPGIGPATERRLHAHGIRTVGDLSRADPRDLERRLGSRGPWLHRLALGEDDRGLTEGVRVRKSRSSSRTFEEDVTDLARLRTFLADQLRALCDGLQRAGERARTVTLTVRYADFTTITRSVTLARPTDQADDALPEIERLLHKTEAGTVPVRLLGVTFSNFEAEGDPADPDAPLHQLDLPFLPMWNVA